MNGKKSCHDFCDCAFYTLAPTSTNCAPYGLSNCGTCENPPKLCYECQDGYGLADDQLSCIGKYMYGAVGPGRGGVCEWYGIMVLYAQGLEMCLL